MEWKTEYVDRYDTFLFDCDGVIWRNQEPIEGAKESLAELRRLKKRVLFISNNATKNRDQYLQKFRDFGIEAEKGEIFNSAYIVAQFLSTHTEFDKNTDVVLLIGERGLMEELEEKYIRYIYPLRSNEYDSEMIKAVVVGLDREFAYYQGTRALRALTDNKDCMFISSNQDLTFPVEGGKIIPGAGSIVAMIRAASGKEPTNMGKPEQHAFKIIQKEFNLDPKRTLMIGDKCDTDIAFGNRAGTDTMLVYSGITRRNDYLTETPTYTLESVASLF